MSKIQYYSVCSISDLDDGVASKLLNSQKNSNLEGQKPDKLGQTKWRENEIRCSFIKPSTMLYTETEIIICVNSG